jgi:large conductance mechanosensitive channel
MINEFKTFIMRGNVLDLAVGIIIGVAFGAIISSFVDDIISPIIGLALGGVDFSNVFINLSSGNYNTLAEAQAAGAATINIGLFINAIINFLIVAFVLFMIIKAFNRMQRPKPEEAAVSPPTNEEVLLAEIRDLLRQRV